MQYDDMFSIVRDLPFDTEEEVYLSDTARIYLLRPSELPRNYSSYNPKTNIQIWLEEPQKKPFKPNHLRILIDLKLRIREHPALRYKFLEAFDRIFYGEAPLYSIEPLQKYHYTQHIGSLEATAILAQLFIIALNAFFISCTFLDYCHFFVISQIFNVLYHRNNEK